MNTTYCNRRMISIEIAFVWFYVENNKIVRPGRGGAVLMSQSFYPVQKKNYNLPAQIPFGLVHFNN